MARTRTPHPGLIDRIEADEADWDDEIERLAATIKTPSMGKRPVRGKRPRWDAKAGCWVTYGLPARQKPQDARLVAWKGYRSHPLFGSLVEPARAAEGGWIKDDGKFWSLVERETLLIQKALLREKFNHAA